ncbi:hypothetical protein AWZ03_006892 [Drosophila navojoa]|uniref:Gustatory receptor n=1 Tax=Drosophila navojoa TaxID=7232 RepID=A0A484BEJ8_DRONA|nr:hypothetical protein AWZ03_006892 [Drosophila navojoa]
MMESRRLQRLLYELFAYYAIFIGASSYRYDFKQRLFKNTKWTQLIASVSNVLQLGIAIMDLVWAWFYVANLTAVTGETIQVDSTVKDVVCLVRILQRVSRERATRKLGKELRCISSLYRYRRARSDMRDKEDMRRLQCIYLVKNCILWLLVGFILSLWFIALQFFGLSGKNIYMESVLIVLNFMAMDSQNVTMHLHFLLSWRICRLYMRLNSHIRRLVRGNSPEDTLELQHLRWQHLKLTALMERLTADYAVIMISNRLSLIVSAAAVGYYISFFRSDQTIYQIVGYGLYVLLAVDGYVLDLILDWTVKEHQKTLFLLQLQNELDQPDPQLSRGHRDLVE